VTIAALLTVEIVLLGLFVIGLISLINSGYLPEQLIEAASTSYSPILRHYLAQTPPDQDGIAVWLEHVGLASSINIPLTFEATDEVFVVGRDGMLLAVKPPDLLGSTSVNQPLDFQIIPGLAEPLRSALAGEEDIKQLYSLANPGDYVIMTLPVWDTAHQQVLGALVAMGRYPTLLDLLSDVAPILAVSLLIFTLVAGIAGTLYGFLAARSPVLRLNQLADATLAWSQGDFRVTVDDPSRDELGQLARRLNDMAQQLEQLLDTRQELALVEERNRLARDLHDSAKQLAFAAAAQMNAARSSLQQDPQAAHTHIEAAEQLTKQLRQELSNLIGQLRPMLLEDKSLAAAVREYTADFAKRNEILVEVHVEHERSLPVEIEQTVFRILQEALANVARHSQASRVEIALVYSKSSLTCTITDNGVGFDPLKKRTGYGLRSMQERASAMGGHISVESILEQGTSISLSVPIRSSATYNEEKLNG
jgi:signal transduction histidine kinase